MLYDEHGRPGLLYDAHGRQVSVMSIGSTVVDGSTEGSVLFVGPGLTLSEDNANFFWDDANNQLKLGLGSALFPAYSFKTYPDIGMWAQMITGSQNALSFSVDGVEAVRVVTGGDVSLAVSGARLALGGFTVTKPSIKATGDALVVELADGSAKTGLQALHYKADEHVEALTYMEATTYMQAGQYVQAHENFDFRLRGRSRMSSPANGVMLFRDSTETTFDRMQFGGTTTAFPALKRNGANLEVKLADDSNFTSLRVGPGTTTSNVGLQIGGANYGILFGSSMFQFIHASTGRFAVYSGGSVLDSGSSYGFSSGAINASRDLFLFRGGGNILDLSNGANAQTFRIYNTTDGSGSTHGVYQRFAIRWNAGTLDLTNEAGGGASANLNIAFRTNGAEKARVSNSGFNAIEYALGATVASPTVRIYSTATGVLRLTNEASSDFNRLCLGGTTSAFPALKRSSATIAIRLADDSADAALTCLNAEASGYVQCGAASQFRFNGRSRMSSPSDGAILFTNAAASANADVVAKSYESGLGSAASPAYLFNDGLGGKPGYWFDFAGGQGLVFSWFGVNYYRFNPAAGQMALLSNTASLAFGVTSDVGLERVAANVLAMRQYGNAQELRIYGFWTNDTITEYLSIKHHGNASNIVFQSNKGSSSGSLRHFYFNGDGIYMRLPIKTTTGDPTGEVGAIYYNSADGLLRAYTGASWKTVQVV